MKLDPGQTIFNDPEVAIWSGVGIGFCISVAIVISDPKLFFIAFLAFFIFAPLIAVSLYSSRSPRRNRRHTLFTRSNGTYLESLTTSHSAFTDDEERNFFRDDD